MALSAGAQRAARICETLERDAANGLDHEDLASIAVSLASALEATFHAMGFQTDGEQSVRSAS